MAGLAAVGLVVLAVAWRRDRSEQRSRLLALDARVRELEERPANAGGAAAPAGADPAIAAPPPAADLGAPGVPLPPDAGAPARASRESDLLADPQTGLFSEGYFRVALDARISAARRHLRPVAVVILDVVQGLESGRPVPADPKVVAESIAATVRDADTACRMDDGRFALVLEDTPENGAIWTVERVRRRLAEAAPGQTLWAGVACYPAHAFDSDEILSQTEQALRAAREWRQDRIEVAIAP
ncbi:MAG: diguanylate cyclase [Acidimicrobiales bacterium]|nr:diguanylate cyclase [Acidimicrobiales bacterium]MCB9371872.1 diguanylate cyclase [Microthrixaceae bacterium]